MKWNARSRRRSLTLAALGAAIAFTVLLGSELNRLWAQAQAGADVVVNNPGADTAERTTQSETALAVLGNTICAGYNDSGGGFSGLSRSANLGATWVDQGSLGQSGDPVLAVDRTTGTFYYAEIATIGGNPAIGVARSTNDCVTFGAAVNASPVASGLAGTTLNDKPWIAVDNTGGPANGNIYVCWTRFFTGGSELRFSRSTDGGVNYQNEQILAPDGTAPFGCSVGVGPGGEVNLAWADRVGATANDIRFRRSTDAGLNFSAAVSASTGNRHPGIDTVVTCGAGNNRPTLTGQIRMLHQAWLAVDATGGPFDGNLYVVWGSDPVGTPDNSDVLFSRSTNGGVNWSTPVQLGAGGGATDQFEPFVVVGGGGTVSVAWYDRRNDPTNNLIDLFTTFSRDGGASFDPITRVTDVSFPVPPINPNFDPGVVNCYMGEYIAVTADINRFYYAWGDNRNTLMTALFPGGRPDPDVFFDSRSDPGVRLSIDIKPGSFPNSINPVNKGVIPVAILTTRTAQGDPFDFDATTVDQLSVRFGPDGATEAHERGHLEDVDGDGDLDLVLHFATRDTGILCGNTSTSLTGTTVSGFAISGFDSIRTVGCR